jgi:hypothetical protein
LRLAVVPSRYPASVSFWMICSRFVGFVTALASCVCLLVSARLPAWCAACGGGY